jgi:hypothetical protein
MRKGHGTKIDAIFSKLNVTFVKTQGPEISNAANSG